MKKKLAETVFTPEASPATGRGAKKFTFPPESTPLEGYTIKRGIHRGGFGEVYYALSDAGKEVALKLLQQHMDIELRGVSQCLNLKHQNLVNIFDIRTDGDGDHWIIMEYVSGRALDEVLDDYPDGMPVADVENWMKGMVAGLSFLHDRGIVHRDLKPANIFTESSTVKIGDVGLSKFISESHRSAHTQSVGTVYYMAPEVAHGRYGREVDIYSMGIMLYELLTGCVPFDGESAGEILMKHLSENPNLEPVPEKFRPVLARALEKDPLRRTQTAAELLDEFTRAASGEKIPQHEASQTPPINAAALSDDEQARESFQRHVEGVKRHAAREARKAARHAGREARKYARNAQKAAIKEAAKAARDAKRAAWKAVKDKHGKTPPPLPCDRSWFGKKKKSSVAGAKSPADQNWLQNVPGWVKIAAIVVIILGLTNNLSGAVALGVRLGILAAIAIGVYHLVTWMFGGNQANHPTATQPYAPGQQPPDVEIPHVESPTDDQAPPSPEAQYAYYAYAKKKPKEKAKFKAKVVKNAKLMKLDPDTPRLIPMRHRVTDLTAALTFSVLATALITAGLMFFTQLFPDGGSAGLFAMTTVLGSWSVLAMTKLSEGRQIDTSLKRLVMLAAGLAVGSAAYGIDSALMVDIPGHFTKAHESIFRTVGTNELVTSVSRQPTWMAYMVFFGGLFGICKWWLQADLFRKKQFSIGSVLGTTLLAFILTKVWVFPDAWAITWAATISSVVHLSASWIPVEERQSLVKGQVHA